MAPGDLSASVRPLRLLALDGEDVAVISAHLQDAVVRLKDIVYLPALRRFALLADRFDWCAAAEGRMERCRAGIHFDHVEKVAQIGIAQDEPATVLNLLSIVFTETDPPEGIIQLTFSGGAVIRLHVECVDGQMRDIGPRWATRRKPGHAASDTAEPL